MALDVSVIIVNYCTAEMTHDCIESIYKNTSSISFEIIVVDNASNDNSDDLLGNDSRILYIKNRENYGFGKANNIGFSYAHGKYVFFLNSDTILTDNAIKYLYDFDECNKKLNLGTIGILLSDKNGRINGPFSFFKKPYAFFRNYKSQIKKKIEITEKNGYAFVDYVCGADMFIQSSVFKKMNGFDERFFMYCEEIELQKRLKEKGYQNCVVKNTGIIHFEGGSFSKEKKDQYKRYYMRRESLLRYFFIHHKSNIVNRISVFIIIVRDLYLKRVSVDFRETISLLRLPFIFKFE